MGVIYPSGVTGELEGAVVVSNGVDDLSHLVIHITALVHPLGYSAVGIHNCRVIAVSENLTDFRK